MHYDAEQVESPMQIQERADGQPEKAQGRARMLRCVIISTQADLQATRCISTPLNSVRCHSEQELPKSQPHHRQIEHFRQHKGLQDHLPHESGQPLLKSWHHVHVAPIQRHIKAELGLLHKGQLHLTCIDWCREERGKQAGEQICACQQGA